MADIDDIRWTSVTERDSSAVGLFVYAVATTGVYCAPGCASRRPRRENVRFFLEPGDALAAGFRACKRCRPDSATPARPEEVVAVVAACRQIAEGQGNLAEIATSFGWSGRHFRRLFRDHTGLTLSQFQRATRAGATRLALSESESVDDGMREGGYTTSRAFYEQVGERLGMTPSSYRRGGEGETILWGVSETSLGEVLVAATRRGVCAVRLGEAPALRNELFAEFPDAEMVEDASALTTVFAVVADIAAGRPQREHLPLDLQGTTFQMEVWEALRRIPLGETWSYSHLAREAGRPSAHRAAASACGANPAALLVPCHRVVRSDGTLGGYRWGVTTKEELLKNEGAGEPERPPSTEAV